jgi:hypothetical protein
MSHDVEPAHHRDLYLVLLGAGHAHIQVLQGDLAHSRPDKLRITVIAPVCAPAVFGMVPGFVASHYRTVRDSVGGCWRTARRTIKDIAVAIDAVQVTLASGDVATWDLLAAPGLSWRTGTRSTLKCRVRQGAFFSFGQ